MARLAQQHHVGVTDELQQQVVVIGISGDRVDGVSDDRAEWGIDRLSHLRAPGQKRND
jgi:hypothetical protein